jgi:hypothetical protein
VIAVPWEATNNERETASLNFERVELSMENVKTYMPTLITKISINTTLAAFATIHRVGNAAVVTGTTEEEPRRSTKLSG